MGIVYISHRLAEVKRVADRVAVLRDGRNAGELARQLTTTPWSADGRPRAEAVLPRSDAHIEAEQPRLRAAQAALCGGTSERRLASNRAGEIVGMAGLVGAGRTELAEALFGIRPVSRRRDSHRRQRCHIAHPHRRSPRACCWSPRIGACMGWCWTTASASISACRTSIV